jgi:spectinomycin phosphotransferase/16S rRNA (guanine(1405)-N(7))-methyltransferase
VLTPPDGVSEKLLVSTVARHWGLEVAAIGYRAVGFGSHHWEISDAAGARWFVTVDELRRTRQSLGETLDAGLDRLRHALAAAGELRALGCEFVVAPVASWAGEQVVSVGDEFAVATYPFVQGTSFHWGEFSSKEHRLAVLDMVVAVHAAPAAARKLALADSYGIPNRDELDAALDGAHDSWPETGPYTRPMLRLLGGGGDAIRTALERYDRLVSDAAALPSRSVLTHGEPHPGNTMWTDSGWRLIDWDTTLVAPPERDLWSLDSGDGSVFDSYAAATGVRPVAALVELYRSRWDLADLAIGVSRFLAPHRGTVEDEESWRLLLELAGQIGA